MTPRAIILPLCVSSYLFAHALEAQEGRRSLRAAKISSTITIDGVLDMDEWPGESTSEFFQREPAEGAVPSERTEVRFAYDDRALHVGIRLFDSRPDSVIGLLARRDEDSQSDYVLVAVDPALDRRTGYYFVINPAGAIQDGTFSNDLSTDSRWDAVWDAAARVDSAGWTAEFRIPYSQIRFHASDSYVWGVEIGRCIKRKNEVCYLALHPRSDYVRVSRWPELHGIAGITPPARIEVLPYLAATAKLLRKPPVDPFNEGRHDPYVLGRDYSANVGADVKVGLAGDVTLDLTLNPDFAQVEVDPAVVNLTAYETQFAEKRPFFMEGSHILSFGRGGAGVLQDFNWQDPDFFYSRRIGRAPRGAVPHGGFLDTPDRTTILGAAKVSGKITDTWSFAALTALTDREYARADSAGVEFREEVEPVTLYGAARTLKEFDGARQGVGLITTFMERGHLTGALSNLLNDRAMTAGADGWAFLDEERVWVITGWAGASRVTGSPSRMLDLQQSAQHYFQRPDAGHVAVDSAATGLAGWASRVWLDKVSGNWLFNAGLGAISPGFETNDAGYLRHADYINGHVYLGYAWYEPGPVFRTKSVSLATYRSHNFGGLRVGESYIVTAVGEFPSYWKVRVDAGYNAETLDDRLTRGGPVTRYPASHYATTTVSSDVRAPISGSLTLVGARSTAGAWQVWSSCSFYWKISRTLSLRGGPEYSRVRSVAQYVGVRTDPWAIGTFGARYLFGTLDQTTLSASLRLNWVSTPALSFQMFLQPLFSTGRYADIKELARPRSFAFNTFGQGGTTIVRTPSGYTIDPDGGGPAEEFPLRDPDFNFKSLRLNTVLRWEYLPGSVLYVVWTHEKTHVGLPPEFRLGGDARTLLREPPDNVFSLKITYWWDP